MPSEEGLIPAMPPMRTASLTPLSVHVQKPALSECSNSEITPYDAQTPTPLCRRDGIHMQNEHVKSHEQMI